YVIILAKLKPEMAPPLSEQARFIELPPMTQRISDAVSNRALPALLTALKGSRNAGVPSDYILKQLGITLLPAIVFALVAGLSYRSATEPLDPVAAMQSGGLAEPSGSLREGRGASGGVQEPPGSSGGVQEPPGAGGGLQEPPAAGGLQEPPSAGGGLKEPPGSGVQEPPGASGGVKEPPTATSASTANAAAQAAPERRSASRGFWIGLGVGAIALFGLYAMLSFQRLEVFKMLLASFFPLVILILAVLGSIVFGLATPTEAAAVGAFGGFILAAAYRQLNMTMVKESVFLTAKTSAMVCWLFVGSAIFSAAFALLGGQELVERWVMSMNLSKTQFLLLSQAIIFVLGWPLEWTEIIVIFMPIFIPLLDNFGVDPLFFGLLVALNLQTAFLSPPVAMAAFYLKGVSPPHVTLNQIFAGMLPFMGIQVLAIFLLYMFPAIGLWLPQVLYK
ncbi:MAG TPA: TRAP transporter large permease subunit, partial [Piscinibacter sp.]|nr:TRAP transporter large permease subunit [Piscinibacter sp.]